MTCVRRSWWHLRHFKWQVTWWQCIRPLEISNSEIINMKSAQTCCTRVTVYRAARNKTILQFTARWSHCNIIRSVRTSSHNRVRLLLLFYIVRRRRRAQSPENVSRRRVPWPPLNDHQMYAVPRVRFLPAVTASIPGCWLNLASFSIYPPPLPYQLPCTCSVQNNSTNYSPRHALQSFSKYEPES